MTVHTDSGRMVDAFVDRWVEEGLITTAQAERMHAEVLEHPDGIESGPTAGRGASVVAEALGYLGGAVILVGSILIGSFYWDELGQAARLAVVAVAAVMLLAAGAFVPPSLGGAGERLRSVLWLASTGAASGFLGVLVGDALELSSADAFLVVAGGTAAYAAALWLWGRGFVQQVAMVVSLALTAVAVINRADVTDHLAGLGAWGVGLAWAASGWAGIAQPRRPVLALGSALAVVGAMATGGSDAGMVLTLVTIVAVVASGVAMRDLLLLAVGTVAALVNTPAAMTRWFPDSVAAAFALVVVGAALVVTAVWVTRGGAARRPPR